ncbi:MAG: hypothetical protein M5U34_00755 [Chloroflexi bacterium]|nr:hypothetical protein [Chloroflexota bacterium]
MTITEQISGAAAFDQLKDEWDALAAQGMTNTPFQTRAYQETWWRNLHPAGSTLHTPHRAPGRAAPQRHCQSLSAPEQPAF